MLAAFYSEERSVVLMAPENCSATNIFPSKIIVVQQYTGGIRFYAQEDHCNSLYPECGAWYGDIIGFVVLSLLAVASCASLFSLRKSNPGQR